MRRFIFIFTGSTRPTAGFCGTFTANRPQPNFPSNKIVSLSASAPTCRSGNFLPSDWTRDCRNQAAVSSQRTKEMIFTKPLACGDTFKVLLSGREHHYRKKIAPENQVGLEPTGG